MKCYVDSEYHSPLFLDCCGLLRRVLRDLRHDFGFRVGPWNQSYLFDTLPIIVEREEDMKPGDLVFVSALYHNTNSMFFAARRYENVQYAAEFLYICPFVRLSFTVLHTVKADQHTSTFLLLSKSIILVLYQILWNNFC